VVVAADMSCLLGYETAELLASKGKKVTLLEMTDELARDMNPLGEGMRHFLLGHLKELGVEMKLKTKYLGVRGKDVLIEDEGGQTTLAADAVVLSLGVRSVAELDEFQCQQVFPEVYRIGDALKPRTIWIPLRSGSIQSTMRRSKVSSRARPRPVRPSPAISAVCPSPRKTRASIRDIFSSSSMIRTRGIFYILVCLSYHDHS